MKVLVVGAGGAGRMHLNALVQYDQVELFVHDISNERALALAAEYPGNRVVAVEDADAPADVVVICIPPRLHCAAAQAHLAMGRRVVVEKPLALAEASLQALSDLEAAGAPIYAAEGQCYGGFDDVTNTRLRVESGEFGGPVLWHLTSFAKIVPQEWLGRLDVGGGAMMEVGSHICAVGQVIFGKSCGWWADVRCGRFGPDMGVMVVDYEEGHQLTLHIGWGCEASYENPGFPLAPASHLFGRALGQQFYPGSGDPVDLWSHLFRCFDGDDAPIVTVAQVANAVRDVKRCYAACGVGLGVGEDA